jgi:hypothetical protein
MKTYTRNSFSSFAMKLGSLEVNAIAPHAICPRDRPGINNIKAAGFRLYDVPHGAGQFLVRFHDL